MYNGFDLQYADINECLSYKGGCEYQCTNTQGSYTCSCPTGYSLYSHTACKGKSSHIQNSCLKIIICIDINECSSHNGGCSSICKNTPGSFYCQCHIGYSLANDGFTCNGEVVFYIKFIMLMN